MDPLANVVSSAKWFGGFLACVLLVTDAAVVMETETEMVQELENRLQSQKQQQQQRRQRLRKNRQQHVDLVALVQAAHVDHAQFGGCALQDVPHHAAMVETTLEMEIVAIVNQHPRPHLLHAVNVLLVCLGCPASHANAFQTVVRAQIAAAVPAVNQIRQHKQQQQQQQQA